MQHLRTSSSPSLPQEQLAQQHDGCQGSPRPGIGVCLHFFRAAVLAEPGVQLAGGHGA